MIGPKFLEKVFNNQSEATPFLDPLQALLCDEFIAICRDFDTTKIQDSWSWRNTHSARELSKIIINEKGEIDERTLIKAIRYLEENLFSLGPGRYHDGSRQIHLLKILKLFQEKNDFKQALKKIGRPHAHQGSERLLRETLFLDDRIPLTDAHARQAAFSALLTSLRQNVGSCFATAPAILIQQDQPLKFLADINQLLGTGRLTRVFEGVEYSVPLSVSWGMGDLLRPFYPASLGENFLKILASSPGLQAALTAVGLIENSLGRDEKRGACEELLKKGVFTKKLEDPFALVTTDQILKGVLLGVFGITESDITLFRERATSSSYLGVFTTHSGKSLDCSRFLKAHESAKGAFKSLTDNALLKAWEFSLASLSESKADFAKWNLYTSLGVHPEEPHGIGESLQAVIQRKITEINEEIAASQSRYDHLYAQAKYLEGRMSNASSEREQEWVRAEYRIRGHDINRVLSERDEVYDKGRRLQGLYPFLIDFYGKRIRDYFQEVYDAEMHDISANPYDDSPAGFRLLYKHGRLNTSLWTMIYSAAEYIQYLTAFFVSTETDLNQQPELEGLQKEISELVTTVITTIKRPDFLESSLIRLAKAYGEPLIQNPLENLEKVKRKPWVYVSGGTMSTLISCYWGNPKQLEEQKRWVESENEYLAFLIDTLKELPKNQKQMFRIDPERSMLAFSPTHAFLCKPGWKLFRQAWESDSYTYTWIRDNWMRPQKKFLDSILLDQRMMDTLIQHLLPSIPVTHRALAAHLLKNFSFAMTPSDFREKILTTLSYERGLQGERRLDFIAEEIDALLYRSLPLFPEHQLKEKLTTLFDAIDEITPQLRAALSQRFNNVEEITGKYRILSALDLKNIAKALLAIEFKTTRTPLNYHQIVTRALQKTDLSYPEPLAFADTNWVNNVFGFTTNPGTEKLELWRFDEYGGEGRPISAWRNFLNGSNRGEWGLYTQPSQYGQF